MLDTSWAYVRSLISKGQRSLTSLSKDPLGSILIAGTDQPDRDELIGILASAGHKVECRSLEGAVAGLQADDYDILIADLPEIENILGPLSTQGRVSGRPKLIALLDHHSQDKVVEMMKLGAGDCLPRPLHKDYVLLVVKRVLEHLQLIDRAEEGERYKRMSKLDGLTELYNHRHFHELLSIELERATRDQAPVTVLMIDVDRFKAYNDTNGHLAGDAALRQIAGVLSSSVRSYDVVARYGGEEFALMLPGTDQDRGLIVAKRLVERIGSATFPHEDSLPDGKLTVSVGVASFPTVGRDKDRIIEGADAAMYAAKSQGGNAVHAATREPEAKASA